MLQQIVTKTPVWVWPLLGFLIYRGMVASVDREVALKKVFIIPVVMLVLSLQGIASAFGANPAAAPVWLAGLIAGAVLTWQVFDTSRMRAHPERGSVELPGSWMTLALILGIFLTKYAVNVALAMQPDLKQQVVFVATVCALFGLFNGVFAGQVLRIAALFRGGVARTKNFL